MATDALKVKSYVSDFTIRLGPIMTVGRLVTAKKTASKTTSFSLITPDTHEKIKQVYVAASDDTRKYDYADLARGVMINGEMKVLDKSEVDDAKESDLPKNVLSVTVHERDEVDHVLWHGDSSYIFEPKVNDEWYGALVRTVADARYSFLGMSNLKGHESLYRLVVWNDLIVVERMLFPSEINRLDVALPTVSDDVLVAATEMVGRVVQPFDAASYVNATQTRLENLIGVTADAAFVTTTDKKPC